MHAIIQDMLDKYDVTEATREFIAAGHQKMFIGGQFVESGFWQYIRGGRPLQRRPLDNSALLNNERRGSCRVRGGQGVQ